MRDNLRCRCVVRCALPVFRFSYESQFQIIRVPNDMTSICTGSTSTEYIPGGTFVRVWKMSQMGTLKIRTQRGWNGKSLFDSLRQSRDERSGRRSLKALFTFSLTNFYFLASVITPQTECILCIPVYHPTHIQDIYYHQNHPHHEFRW